MSVPLGKISWADLTAEDDDSFIPGVTEETYAQPADNISRLASRVGELRTIAEDDPGSSRPPGFGFLLEGRALALPEDSKTMQSVVALPPDSREVGQETRKRGLECSEEGETKLRRLAVGPTTFPVPGADPIFPGVLKKTEVKEKAPEEDVEATPMSPSPAEKVTRNGIAGLMKNRESLSSSSENGDVNCWTRRQQLRERQVAIGKSTHEYQKYQAEVPADDRKVGVHPVTPDPTKKVSKRTFDAEMRTWRKALHELYQKPGGEEYINRVDHLLKVEGH
ncbi:hypothetical protein FOL47_007891 [Perkinsus chesapeaki]|uniref:Histone RNA hairpin-binding protein RNA-binding domain-containing protein n=1 Tax=Perkinsus chesapeaki TaxID=330153 RepID=A0A7J6LH87_PERCH|nr:hypothetical protein FOL47_007891 [Perkinsus chesapeaki]